MIDELEPYEYTPPSGNVPSQARRNARGKALCLAELDGDWGNLIRQLEHMIEEREEALDNRKPHDCRRCLEPMTTSDERWEGTHTQCREEPA